MLRTQLIVMALAGTALVALPASAGGLLGGRAANCLCQGVHGLAVGSLPVKTTSIGRGIRGTGQLGAVTAGPRGSRAISGNVTRSVNSALNVTVARSIDRRSGRMTANTRLLGNVRGGARGAGKFNDLSRSVGLAGRSSTQGSINSWAGVTVTGLGTNRAYGLAGNTTGMLHGKARGSGQLVNVSVLNKTGATGRPAVNIAALNGTGGRSGKVANLSVLNKTGTRGRSAVNVAALNGAHGTSGKIVNVSALNKTGTTGRSLANVAVLNGSAGGTGRGANVAVLNGHYGKGHGTGDGSLGLPKGVQIINGVPCGPDGKPLTGASAASVMAIIGGGGGSHHSGSGNGTGGLTSGNSGNGAGSAGGAGSSGGGSTAGSGHSRDRDMAERKDLWWSPYPQRQSRDGRLNDH